MFVLFLFDEVDGCFVELVYFVVELIYINDGLTLVVGQFDEIGAVVRNLFL